MENRPSAVDKMLKDMINQNMDKDTFVVVDQRPASSQLPSTQTVVLNADNQRDSFPDGFAKVLKTSSTSTVAVVDRSADIPAAARSIIRSQIRFNGKSPYAPNVVLVNEFAIEDFCQAAVKCLTEEFSASEHAKSSRPQPRATTQKISHETNSRTLISTAKGEIELLLTRFVNASIMSSQKLCKANALTQRPDHLKPKVEAVSPVNHVHLEPRRCN